MKRSNRKTSRFERSQTVMSKTEDDCLREKLMTLLGRNIGPVTESTRSLYQRKLRDCNQVDRMPPNSSYAPSPRTPEALRAQEYKSPTRKLFHTGTPEFFKYQMSSPPNGNLTCSPQLNFSPLRLASDLSQNTLFSSPNSPFSYRGSYRPELEDALENRSNSIPYTGLEEEMQKEFRVPDGNNGAKTFYNYLLLDEGVTQNLPNRKESLSTQELTRTFIQAIFYIGKGKSGRSYDHLQKAATIWKERIVPDHPKEKRIVSIWDSDRGIVCLQIFHNSSSDEALTREAAMIDAIGRDNLTNLQKGKYYRRIATWPKRDQRCLGVCLLWKAREIFISEGERALRPCDI